MTISPEQFTNVDSAVLDQNDIFYKEYENRVEDWECDEEMDEYDFALIHFDEARDWENDNLDWVSVRYNMWYTCGVYLGEFDDDIESFCEWYNSTQCDS